jgi:membrane protein DedA with SNARE-associated domain
MVGTFFRSILFLIFGYTGLSAYRTVLEGMGSIESLIQILIVLALGGAIVWMYYRRAKKRSGAHL